METTQLENIWLKLKNEAQCSADRVSRLYRALGKTTLGVRASYILLGDTYELLIEIPNEWKAENELPEWQGLRFSIIDSPFPSSEIMQLNLALLDKESWDIFLFFASDITVSLEYITEPSIRLEVLIECISRWNRFFQQCGAKGLSEPQQRGLWAEIYWLNKLLEYGIKSDISVLSWKGCERSYYDYDLLGRVVEVKSTISKEPRRVQISNEKQLDGKDLRSLHMYVTTLQMTDSGVSLPAIIENTRTKLQMNPKAQLKFNQCLVSSGYLDSHQAKYPKSYIVKSEELYSILNGFPRIISVPVGIGDLKYSVVLGNCKEFKQDIEEYLDILLGEANA